MSFLFKRKKETFFKGLFFHFTSAFKQDLKCPSAYSCPCALKDATAFSKLQF